MTYRELVYMVLDEAKAISDDIPFNEDHILFLLSKYRSYILKNTYSQFLQSIPESNYQTICVDLDFDDNDFCGMQALLISNDSIPSTMSFGTKDIYTKVGFNYSRFLLTDFHRFKHIGKNKFTKNIGYVTIGPDNRLYVKSQNNTFMHINKLYIHAIFDDILEASNLECSDDCDSKCDIIDKVFPLEDSLVSSLIQIVVQDISAAMYRLSDNENNAADDTDDLAQMISRYTNAAYYKATHPNSKSDS